MLKIPEEIDGSFSFDYNEEEEYKLINIEARDGKWIIYSTKNVKLISNNAIVESSVITNDNFYVIRRNDTNYLLYVSDSKQSNVKIYNYNETINLLIGNNDNANIKYVCPYLSNSLIKISYKENRLILENLDKIFRIVALAEEIICINITSMNRVKN